MRFPLERMAGFVCLLLMLGCSRSGVPIATAPHVYDSSDPEMQAYVLPQVELDQIKEEIYRLDCIGKHPGISPWNKRYRQAKALCTELQLQKRRLKREIAAMEASTEEASADPSSSPGRVRFGDGPMVLAK